MNKKNISIDLDTNKLLYEDGLDNPEVIQSLAIVNARIHHAIVLVNLGDLAGAGVIIDMVRAWIGLPLSTINATSDAYSAIKAIYEKIYDSELTPLPPNCPFVTND